MVDLEMLQLVRDLVTIIGVIAGFTYYVLAVRSAQKSRQTEMFMRLYQTSIDPESYTKFWDLMAKSWKDLEDYMQKYSPETNPEGAADRMSHWSIYDGLGILVKNKIFGANIVYRMLDFRIIMMWYKFEAVIKELRKLIDGPGPDYMENFEWLANKTIKMREMEGLPDLRSRIGKFIKY